jgi:CHAT domain-containing protein/tetratricopeptide (TPR) repeat protein
MKLFILILVFILSPLSNKLFAQSYKRYKANKNEIKILLINENFEEAHRLAKKYKIPYVYSWIVEEIIDSFVLDNNLDKALFYAKTNNSLKHLDESFQISLSKLKKKKLFDSALVYSHNYNKATHRYFGDKSYYYAKSFLYIGNCYEEINKYDSAIINWTNAIDFLMLYSGIDSLIGDINIKIGNCFAKSNNYPNAVHYFKKSIEIQQKSKKTISNYYANSLMTYAEYLKLAKIEIETSDSIVHEAIKVKVKNSIESQPLFSDSLNHIMRNSKIISNTDNVKILISIADYLFLNSETEYSSFFYSKALFFQNISDNIDSAFFAKCLSKYGQSLYYRSFNFNIADSIIKKAINIQKRLKGEVDPEYASTLLDLGEICLDYGNYSSAGKYLHKSLEIKETIMHKNNPKYIVSLVSLGNYYTETGDLQKAIKYFEQARLYAKKTPYEISSDYAWLLVLLSRSYRDAIKDLETDRFYVQNVETLLNEALVISSNLNKIKSNSYKAKILNDLGNFYKYILNDYKNAKKQYTEALTILKSTEQEQSIDYAIISTNLGRLLVNINSWEAYNYGEDALEILDSYDRNLPESENTLYLLGDAQLREYFLSSSYGKRKIDEYDKELLYDIEYYFARGLETHNHMLYKKMSGIAENERERYWKNNELSYYSNFINDICLYYKYINKYLDRNNKIEDFLQDINYNLICTSKSLLLEATNLTKNIINASTDSDVKEEYYAMQQYRRSYSKLLSNRSENRELILKYKKMADSLDNILSSKLVDYASTKQKFNFTWKNIQDSLKQNQAAIEFARYYDEEDTAYKYMALVVRYGFTNPKFIPLSSENAIRKAVNSKNFPVLYDLVWKDIDTLLNGINTIYYSPAGELNNVAFSALCYNNEQSKTVCNSYLLDKYSLHQLTTTRYIADGTLKKSKPLKPEIALLGGINYDAIPNKNNLVDTHQSTNTYMFAINLQQQKQICGTRNATYKMGMPYLEGTKIEVGTIGSLMNKNKWKVETRTDTVASEHNLKKLLQEQSPGVLHIATHGFAFAEEVKKEKIEMMMGKQSNYRISEDPMVRCGLMLGGGNISWTGQIQKMVHETGEDGILTAAEVANMDLRGTKLAVLSACETGLGQIESTEGTFGLKRGFKLAGVEQIIVSLWSVPDKETMEMMNLFYSDLAITGDPVISFEKSQKAMRERYPTQPIKWAGFVLVR